MSIHEEATYSTVVPMMGVFNNLVMYDQHVPQNSLRLDRAGSGRELVVERGRHRADVQAAPGVKWHDGKPFTAADVKCTFDLLARHREGQAAHQPAQGLVPQRRGGRRQRRFRGDLPSRAAAAGADRAARLRLFADLSLSCAGGRDAAPSDRHRPVQIRRIQAERVHQGRAQPRLLEAGPALSRRHRVHDHPEPVDRASHL